MRIPYGFILASDGVLNINKDEADVISMIFDFYIAGASLGKIVDTCNTQRLHRSHPYILRMTSMIIYNLYKIAFEFQDEPPVQS